MSYTKTNWSNNTAPYINADNLNKIEQGIYDNDQKITGTDNVLGYDEYDNTSTYEVGDYCIYNNKLYVCNTAIATAEEFNSAHWTETSVDGIINGVKNNIETIQNSLDVTNGSGNANSSYISATENNHWEKTGHVVSYSFTMTAKGTWGNTTQFISGLPKAAANTRFSGTNTSSAERPVLRFIITTDGAIQNAYSQTSPVAGNIIEGHITYITSE